MLPSDSLSGLKLPPSFSSWIKNSTSLHERVSIEESTLGGWGLFFDPSDEDTEGMELLRVPAAATLDYKLLLGDLEMLKEIEKDLEDKESDMIVQILKAVNPASETEILMCFCWAMILQKKESPFRQYDPYLAVLREVNTVKYPEPDDSDIQDQFLIKLACYAQRYEEMYAVCENIKGFDLSFETFYQLAQAVVSRTLEIPHGIDNDDFYTNVTMVPVLDFVNHSHDNNAYFDVDRETSAVVLKLKNTFNKKSELKISYRPEKDVEGFAQAYGFIPSEAQLVEYSLFDLPETELVENFELICKWLHININFTCYSPVDVVQTQNVATNLWETGIPLLFLDGLEYNETWDKVASDSFSSTHNIPLDDEQKQQVKAFLHYQQENCDSIYGVPPIGVLRWGKPINSVQELRNQDGETKNRLLSRAFGLLSNYTNTFPVVTGEPHSFKRLAADYLRLKVALLRLLPSMPIDLEKSLYLTPEVDVQEFIKSLNNT